MVDLVPGSGVGPLVMTISDGDSPRVQMPKTVQAAWRIKREAGPEARYIAGGTALQAEWASGVSKPPRLLISLDHIAELRYVQECAEGFGSGRSWYLGALVSLAFCRQHPPIGEHFPLLTAAALQIAAPAVRNRGSIGGNVMTLGDSVPALLALEAGLVWYHRDETATESLEDWVDKGCPLGDRLLIAIRLPEPTVPRRYLFEKVMRREQFAPSVLTVAAQWETAGSLRRVRGPRLAVGGGGSRPVLLTRSQRLLDEGAAPASPGTRATVLAEVLEKWAGGADAAASYRAAVAANLLVAGLAGR